MRSLNEIAQSIDFASDASDEALLLRLSSECEKRLTAARGEDRAHLRYYQANAHAGIMDCRRKDLGYAWNWEQPDGVRVILLLRQAIAEPSFKTLNKVYVCQIRTNLASRLNELGRPIAANEQWLKVEAIIPNFAKSLASRARGLESYARVLYDVGHRNWLLRAARDSFDKALDPHAFWESSDRNIHALRLTERRDEIVRHLESIGFDGSLDLNKWPLGSTKTERSYRSWCLRERLFLNPLNDAYVDTVAATDVIHLPDHVYPKGGPPRFPDYYNLLKQEYISARYRLYRSIHEREPAFIMRETHMLDSGEAQLLGHFTEELRSSYRSTYAIFGKVALFLNDYLNVGLQEGAVSLSRLWRENPKQPGVRPLFKGRENWPLRGLYFLSRDLVDEEFQDGAEPDASDLADLRKRLEHRFVSLHQSARDGTSDTHASVSLGLFEQKTLRLLKVAREALIYLSFAVHREERLRQSGASGSSQLRPVLKPKQIRSFFRPGSGCS